MILGVFDGHNASSSIISKKEIIQASSEERFTRKKNFRGFPLNSIRQSLEKFEYEEYEEYEKLEAITVGGIFRKGERLKNIKELQKRLEIPIYYYNHHLCHTALYKLSGFKECLILTMDGGGDGFSSTVSIGKKNKVDIISQSDLIDSIGDFYASVTELLGFKPMEDEGKVMSLSSYDFSECLPTQKIIDYNCKIKTFKNYLGVIGHESTKTLQKIFLTSKNLEWDKKYEISRYAQNELEKSVLKLLKQFVFETGIQNIVFSGGVSQNVKLNKKIIEQEFITDLYVPPFSGDEGLAIGSSLIHSKNNIFELKNTYLGYEIKNNNVNDILKHLESNFSVEYIEDKEIPNYIGNLISSNNIVCVARGKMEFGPRALGNRSILALPTKKNALKISKALKRDSFMPYAPTILDECMSDYLINSRHSPFMTTLFDVFEDKKSKIEGTIHVDGTTRAQTINKEFNKVYYEIVSTVNDITTIPAVLNTSFNLHGEPIVCTEKDALLSFNSIGDALLLGNYLITKI
ncbi:Carbamoyltransferase [Methanococcus vannielii SB]|uniref:Carbamoyltransferase n=1 Tax=Methanococcus vannielii (strain ATCC 35089 / DSM 1224 / JCM 13029 / OCM 148 / SB) TaxID=406327 RepID=A6USG4_METVS|nr:carbamoyltransferase C-terminal domain-containing protein [Methanococcus vannielii]ABR55436.1 Carbamoyltransferase [Methanococcus vannielii SB]